MLQSAEGTSQHPNAPLLPPIPTTLHLTWTSFSGMQLAFSIPFSHSSLPVH